MTSGVPINWTLSDYDALNTLVEEYDYDFFLGPSATRGPALSFLRGLESSLRRSARACRSTDPESYFGSSEVLAEKDWYDEALKTVARLRKKLR